MQNFVAQKTANYLESTWGTRVDIGKFTTDWRNGFVLKDVYVEDLQQDTLWHAERLGVDMRIFSLLKGELNISKVDLDNATLKLHIREDSTTNFDFILEAFATDTAAAQPTDTTAAMAINLGAINLNNIYLVFKDDASGNYLKGRIGEFTTTMEKLDLDAQQYLVDEVELRNTWVNYEQTKIPPPSGDEEPLELDFGLNRAALENVRFKFLNRVAEQRLELAVGKTEVVSDKINLKEARIDLKSFDLHNTSVLYVQEKYKPSDSLAINPERSAEKLDESVQKASGEPVNWVLALGNLDVSGLDVKFDNFNTPRQQRGMDYNHLHFKDVVMQAQDIMYSLNRTVADINQLQLQEQSGFNLQNFQANLVFDSTHTSLTNLDVKTPNSRLQHHLAMQYPSLEAIAERPESINLDIDLHNSYIGMRDVLYFAPDLSQNPSFRNIANSTIKVQARATGPVNSLQVNNLQLVGLKGTNIDLSGNIRNMMDPDNLYLDANIRRFTTTRTDVQALLPAGTVPPNIRIPNDMSLTGYYQGSLTAFDAKADIRTSFGNADLVVDMGPNETFTATVTSGGFALDQLFTDSLGVGTVALTAKATGSGLTPETMQANVQATIQRLDYNNYTYNNVDLSANINRNLYAVRANAQDQNLSFNLLGDFNLRDAQQPVYDFNLDLNRANLQALNLYPEPLSVKGRLKGRFTGADASTISGRLTGDQLLIEHNNKSYPIDSLLMTLEQTGDKAAISIASDIVDAQMRFGNSLATLPTVMQKHFSNYFDLQPDPPFPANLNLKDFTATLNLKKSGLITSFVPGLEQLQTRGPITANYNGDTQQLTMGGTIAKVVYTDYTLQNIDLAVRGNREQLGYQIDLRKVISPSLNMNNVRLEGAARDDNLQVKFTVAGSDTTETNFMLGGIFNSLGKGYRFTFNPDEVIINGDKWDVSENNSLQFDTDFIYANNIALQRNNSMLKLNSSGPVGPGAPMQLTIQNFDLGYLMSSFQPQDSLLMAGTLNGNATVRNMLSGTLSFTSNLDITDFTYQGVPVGNIALEANSTGTNRYNLSAALTGNNNQVNIAGYMEPQANATLLNLNADITNLNIATLQGFTEGIVDDLDGSATGNMRITGTLENPKVLGQLNFNKAQFNLTTLGSVFTLQDERLVFAEEGIRFPNFTVTDSLGNDMVVNGSILTKDYTDFQFDLKVNTERFLALNSTALQNELFYGTVYLDATASISGNMSVPLISVKARVLDGSDFTIVIPADEVAAAEREGIVEFVDLNPTLTAILDKKQKDTTQITGFVGADIAAQLTVPDAVPITIILDPITGDKLVVQGTADPLFIGMKPSGEMNMSGRYTVTSGRYSMDFYDLASRELDIAEGSYINWTGDPLQAFMDITAIYTVETAPRELVASQLAGYDAPVLRNQVPFQVYVFVEGDMLTPDISFDIRLPEERRGSVPPQVLTSLGNLRQDDSELNKQVFALLVLNRFLAPDPFTSSGGGLESTARNSLGQVMTSQLNQLTNRYAGGLGLEFGVDSYQDYSSGTAEGRTDLNVALRQQFLDDRLTVRVGTDIGLEGSSQSSETMSGFGGDISIEYSLTENGMLRVRGFQRNQYEGVIEGGDVRATGVALIFVREYQNLSDLFRSLERRRARDEERRLEAIEKIREESEESQE